MSNSIPGKSTSNSGNNINNNSKKNIKLKVDESEAAHPSIDPKFLQNELQAIQLQAQDLANTSIVACCPLLVRFRISKSKVKEMDVCLNFPPNYPDALILMEVKSRTLPTRFTESVVQAFEKENKPGGSLQLLGRPQSLPAFKFAHDFLESNTLCYCVQEILNIKAQLDLSSANNSDPNQTVGDSLKVRQKQSAVNLLVTNSRYFLEAKIAIPENYPFAGVSLDLKSTNFPGLFQRYFIAQAKEMSRRCTEPPLVRFVKGKKPPKNQKPFEPEPSLEKVATFLISNVKRYPSEPCGLCGKRAFPPDPANVCEERDTPAHLERVYCGHIFHFECIDTYMKTPPFKGGKECPQCKKIIYHEKWKESEQTREERWAHKEARDRELEEVVDFLS